MGLFRWLKNRKLARAQKRSQPFSVAIAHSLRERPSTWEYDDSEKWLNNPQADITISAPQAACVTLDVLRLYSNGGSSRVLANYHHYTPDRLIIAEAYKYWTECTALNRERERETIKARTILRLNAA
jgi:hypothetical protein